MTVEKLLQQERELERARLNGETAKIPWSELQRYFAGGKLLWVTAELDLVDSAWAIQQDDLQTVQAWTASGQLAPATDAQARLWFEREVLLWAVVVKPWVLVQEIATATEDARYGS
jgi:hypothetical protein